jgi:stress response protein SCP2
VPTAVETLIFTVNSFSGESFTGIPNAFCRLVDDAAGSEIARFDLSLEGGSHTGLIMTKLYRHNNEWKMQAIGESRGRPHLPRSAAGAASLSIDRRSGHGFAARSEYFHWQAEPAPTAVEITLSWEPAHSPLAIDSSAFALNAQGKVRGDDDFIFYNQLTLPGGGIQRAGDGRSFTVAFAQLPAGVERIVIALTIDPGPKTRAIVRSTAARCGRISAMPPARRLGGFPAGDENDAGNCADRGRVLPAQR